MNIETEVKYKLLNDFLKGLESVVIGFSGGVDSSLLVKVSYDLLADKSIAVTLVSPMIPVWDLNDARLLTKQLGIEHILFEENTIDAAVSANPADRCYYCKKNEFSYFIKLAKERGFKYVIDGSNADDKNDYRPGTKAMDELKIVSPLKAVGLTKAEIRDLSRYLGLTTWNKPAYACLASRVPYGEKLTVEKLVKIERAESFLHSIGFNQVRVRNHGDIARIELNADDRLRFCKIEILDMVSEKLKALGFLYVCFELEGYSMGSLNKNITGYYG